jgi:hypothetical protein
MRGSIRMGRCQDGSARRMCGQASYGAGSGRCSSPQLKISKPELSKATNLLCNKRCISGRAVVTPVLRVLIKVTKAFVNAK